MRPTPETGKPAVESFASVHRQSPSCWGRPVEEDGAGNRPAAGHQKLSLPHHGVSMSNSAELNAASNARPGSGKLVAIIMLCMAVIGEMCLAADFYGFAAVIMLVSQDLSLTEGQAGLVQGAFGITFALGMLYWAPLGRKI